MDERMKGIGAAVVAAALGLAGCGGGGGEGPSPGPPSPDVTGTIIDTWRQDDGTTVSAPSVPAGLEIAAWVPKAGGGYELLPGTVGADGHFTIPGVGDRAYFLARQSAVEPLHLVEETAHQLDLGRDWLGRRDPAWAETPTSLAIALTGLEPWASGDMLTLVSTGAQLLIGPNGAGPGAGATSAAATFDLQYLNLPAAGDMSWIVQHSRVAPGGGLPTYLVAVRAAHLVATQSMSDGDAVSMGPVPLSAPPAHGTATLDIRGTEFAAQAPVLGTSTVTVGQTYVTLEAAPRSAGHEPKVTLLAAGTGSALADVNFGALDFPRFLPAWFVESRYVQWNATARFAGLPYPYHGVGSRRREPLAGADPIVRPRLGPVRAPRIGGADLAQPQSGVGLTPTISWSAPALGEPTNYYLVIDDATTADAVTVLSADLTATAFEVPEGLLQSGHTYLVFLWAETFPDTDRAAPFRGPGWYESVGTVGEPFTP